MRRLVTIVLIVTIVPVGGLVAAASGADQPTPSPSAFAIDRSTGADRAATESRGTRGPSLADRSAPTDCHEAVVGGGSRASEPRIVELYPNPTTHGNVGEYLVVDVPSGTATSNWTVTDGHTTARFPNETVSGRVAASTDPEVTEPLADDRVIELEGTIRLAVDGDTLELRRDGALLDAVAYDQAPLAHRWYRSGSAGGGVAGGGTNGDSSAGASEERSTPADRDGPSRGVWHPRGATCLRPTTTAVDEVTAFVLPDAPGVPLETLRGAEDRLLLAGYEVTSAAVADALVDAAARGVEVAVLVESGPVGGTPAASEPVLERLEDGDVAVRAIGGEGARYQFHHAKYAVVDDRVLVTSENWKPGGVGGRSSRGWGVRVEDPDLAAALAAVFEADFGGWDTVSGEAFRSNATFVDDGVDGAEWEAERDGDATVGGLGGAGGDGNSVGDGGGGPHESPYPTEHEPAAIPADRVDLLVTPDNAEAAVLDLLAAADEEILVKQASVDGDAPVLEATIEAARRGVDVRILLDSTWYYEDDNAVVREDLERAAADEDLPLAVALVDETDRFEKIHAKGVVIDREVAVVGSANWNAHAFRHNREVLLAIHGEEVASYYADVFEDDWDGETWRLPIDVSIAALVALVLAGFVGRRYVRFGSEAAAGRRDDR